MTADDGQPRVEPIPPREWPPEMRDALAALLPTNPRHPRPEQEGRPKALNALGTFAHHPRLTTAYHTFNGHILFTTTLTVRQRELVVLRVACLRRCAYEWAQHVVIARDNDITDDEIVRVGEGPDAPGWSPLEAALLRATDELLADACVTDGTWAALAAELDEQQLLDLVFTVGAYDVIAMTFLSFGVQIDDDLAAMDTTPLPGGSR